MYLHAPAMCNALSPGTPSTYISLIYQYSSAPKDWFSFHEFPKMTHFNTRSTLSKGSWMRFSDLRGQTGEPVVSDSRHLDGEPLLCFTHRVLPCFCWITKQSVLRICQELAFSLLFLMLWWLMAVSGCVWERGGECRLGTRPESPLFRTYHAKVPFN